MTQRRELMMLMNVDEHFFHKSFLLRVNKKEFHTLFYFVEIFKRFFFKCFSSQNGQAIVALLFTNNPRGLHI